MATLPSLLTCEDGALCLLHLIPARMEIQLSARETDERGTDGLTDGDCGCKILMGGVKAEETGRKIGELTWHAAAALNGGNNSLLALGLGLQGGKRNGKQSICPGGSDRPRNQNLCPSCHQRSFRDFVREIYNMLTWIQLYFQM